MKRYAAAAATLVALLLMAFAVVEWADLPVLTDPLPALDRGGGTAAGIGVALLVADVVVPVPSSLVMVAHGALFGVVGGALLSLAGAAGAAMVGFVLGRRGSGVLASVVPARERRRADELIQRWGLVAVIASRPVPVLAEAVAILAGASTMRAGTMAFAATVGALPGAVLYAAAGALAVGFASGAVVFGVVMVLAGLAWLLGRAGAARHSRPAVPYG